MATHLGSNICKQ